MSYLNDIVYILPKHFRRLEEYEQRKMPMKEYWTKKIWNIEKGTILSRTKSSWAKIIFFYIIFYTCLALLWAFVLYVFYINLNLEVPRYKLAQPGFSFQPCMDASDMCRLDYLEGILFEIDPIVSTISQFLHKFNAKNIDRPEFGPCNWLNYYGFKKNTPCFFLKINRIIGFKVDPIHDANELPAEAPESLKEYIADLPAESLHESRVWISCESSAQDVSITFYPQPFVKSDLLELDKMIKHGSDFYDDSDFQRIVAIQLTNVPMNKNVPVKCFLWAKNIVRETHSPSSAVGKGMISFELNIRYNPDMHKDNEVVNKNPNP